MGDFTVAVKNVDGYENHAEFEASQIRVNHVDGIDEVDAEAVAGAEAFCLKQACEAVTAGIDFPESVFLTGKLEGNGVAPAFEGLVEKVAKIHIRHGSTGVRYCGFS